MVEQTKRPDFWQSKRMFTWMFYTSKKQSIVQISVHEAIFSSSKSMLMGDDFQWIFQILHWCFFIPLISTSLKNVLKTNCSHLLCWHKPEEHKEVIISLEIFLIDLCDCNEGGGWVRYTGPLISIAKQNTFIFYICYGYIQDFIWKNFIA